MPARMSDTLTSLGYDVYYYDQLGCGFSSRLDLRTDEPYTVARNIDDLEAIRAAIGSDQMILIGFSWGAYMASHYMIKYPGHVSKVIFLSPGAIDGRDQHPVPEKSLSPEDSAIWLTAVQPTFRIGVGRQLAAMNSRAAFYLIKDWEADHWAEGWSAEAIRLNRTRGFCNDSLGGTLVDLQTKAGGFGMGFFCSTNIVENAQRLPDPIPTLRENQTPALILRGECDFVGWAVARTYRTTFPNSKLLPIPGAGHLIWVEQPQMYSSAIAAFVADTPLPIADYVGERRPDE
jgi:proline iminopeptidase